jgi:hypothetical protein
LRRLVKRARELDQKLDKAYEHNAARRRQASGPALLANYQKLQQGAAGQFPKFYYKPKVAEEIMLVSDNVADQIQTTLRAIEELQQRRKSASPPTSWRPNAPSWPRWKNLSACRSASFWPPTPP